MRATLGPVAPASRIVEVDMVRGFALFGVLLVNMYNFGAYSVAWDSPEDHLAFAFMRFFFETKSWRLFAMLFGFGFALQLQRAEARGASFVAPYLRRLAVLFLLGAAHGLLYDGDILMLYAELGLVLLVVRRLPTRGLLSLSLALMLVFPMGRLVSSWTSSTRETRVQTADEARAKLQDEQRSHVYVTGSIREIAAANAHAVPTDPFDDVTTPEASLAVLAMFLLGFSVARSGMLRDIPGHAALIGRARTWGLGFGLAAMAVERLLAYTIGYAVFRPQQAGPSFQLLGDLLFVFGATALAIGYAATIILAAQTPRGEAVLSPLGHVGRLALTVYLTQSLMFTTLFYGYGLGRAFRLGPAAVTAWAVLFFGVQIAACAWWVRRFRFGPFEWLWRSATYLKRQPIRAQPSSPALTR